MLDKIGRGALAYWFGDTLFVVILELTPDLGSKILYSGRAALFGTFIPAEFSVDP